MLLTEAWIVKSYRFLHEIAAEAGHPFPMWGTLKGFALIAAKFSA